jgi:hypothetical protein
LGLEALARAQSRTGNHNCDARVGRNIFGRVVRLEEKLSAAYGNDTQDIANALLALS